MNGEFEVSETHTRQCKVRRKESAERSTCINKNNEYGHVLVCVYVYVWVCSMI